jgi:hypothetical protein
VSWQTLNLYRNGAIGFIDWLDVPVVSPTNVKPVFFHISKNQIVAVKFLPINLHHRIRQQRTTGAVRGAVADECNESRVWGGKKSEQNS